MESPPADTLDLGLAHPAAPAARRRAWFCVAAVALAANLAVAVPQWGPSVWASGALLAVAATTLLLLFTRRSLVGFGLLLVVFTLGGAWFTLRTTTTSPIALDQLVAGNDRTLVAVHGQLLSDPAPPTPPRDVLSQFRRTQATRTFDLRVQWLEQADGSLTRARGITRIIVTNTNPSEAINAQTGDSVRVLGWYLPPGSRTNPGEPDHLRYARMNGDAGALFVSSPPLVSLESSPTTPGSLAWRWLHSARTAGLTLLAGDGTHPVGRAMLTALILGEYTPDLRETRSAFQHIGIAHLLAISGFHLAILAGLALFLVRATGDHGRLEPLVVALLIIALLLLVPARIPIVRSGIMVLAILLGDALGRRYDRLTMLGWITLALFLWRPMDVFSLGAQLSVGITALLLWVATARHPWIAPLNIRGLRYAYHSRFRRMLARFRSAAAVCIMCWLVSLPVVAAHTGIVSLSGALTTVLLTPIIIALLAGGYLLLALGTLLPSIAAPLVAALAWIAEYAADGVNTVASLPGIYIEIRPPSMLWAFAAVVVVLVYLRRAKPLAVGPLAAAVVLVAWVFVQNAIPPKLNRSVALRIDMLSVGNGSCIIIRSGSEAILWDCGSLRQDLAPTLERARAGLNLPRVRTAMVTHANLDHYISMPDAARLLGIERLCVSPHILDDHSAPVQALLADMKAHHIAVHPWVAGDQMRFGLAHLQLLWPTDAARDLDENDRSLVARISVPTDLGDRVVLLVGDIEAPAMEALLQSPLHIKADVLEAPHHGSFHATSQRFVAAVGPSVILQSTGWSRAGDTRWDGERARSYWLTTASDGALAVDIMRDGTIRTQTMR